jgi:hypothetical protein
MDVYLNDELDNGVLVGPGDGAKAADASDNPLSGKKVFIPPMAYGSGRAFASSFRAIGVNADIVPPSDERTRELGARYTSGDECYPAKVTVGDFMKLLEQPGVDPSSVAPAGFTEQRLPVGVQIVGAHFGDLATIAAAKFLEREFQPFVAPKGYE